MQKIIITTPEELEGLIQKSCFSALNSQPELSGNPEKKFLSLQEAAQFLDLVPQTIYGLTSKKSIPFYKAGKKLRFLKSDLECWLTANKPSIQK